MVAADSSIVRANAKENADLFWALRGGGGNFGVVTEFEVKLHPLKSVVLAEGLTAESDAFAVCSNITGATSMAGAPIDLKWNIDLRIAPTTNSIPPSLRGRPVAGSSIIWTGDPDAGHTTMQTALALCHSATVSSKIISFLLDLQDDGRFRVSARPPLTTQSRATSPNSTMSQSIAAWDAARDRHSFPRNARFELAYLGGAAGKAERRMQTCIRRPQRAPFIMNLLANWSDPSDDENHISWIRSAFNQLRPAMKPGVYVNFMSGDEQDRVPEAYHQRWDRMVAVKTHYDPKNFFRLNQNVLPRASAQRSEWNDPLRFPIVTSL